MPEPTFGVVLVNWNGCDDTIAALESLLEADPRPDHVVVVDNGSRDDSAVRLRDWGERNAPSFATCALRDVVDAPVSWLLLIAAPDNLGFSGGNNAGLRHLAARTTVSHLLLLNNDAMVAPDYFAQISEALAMEPDVGLLGCTIFYHPDRERVWYAGGYEIASRALLLHHRTVPMSTALQPTVFVTGCAMLIARPLYEAAGGLPELYNPGYWEDGDYSYRARANGWKVMIAPRATVYHRVGASGAGENLTPLTAFLLNRNRGYFVRRNYRGRTRALALGYLALTKPARALVEVLRGRADIGRAMLAGFVRGMSDPTT
jgi:GT2 family glycosyltransferase